MNDQKIRRIQQKYDKRVTEKARKAKKRGSFFRAFKKIAMSKINVINLNLLEANQEKERIDNVTA